MEDRLRMSLPGVRLGQMFRLGLPLLLAVQLGGGFGAASATVLASSGESININIEVEVEVSATAVVAHLVAPGEPQLTLPMLPRSSGVFGITTDLRRLDYQVVFEAIGETSVLSPRMSLTELGADLSVDQSGVTTTAPDEGFSKETIRWGWLGLGLAAAALSALAFWVLGDKDEEKEKEQDEEKEKDKDKEKDKEKDEEKDEEKESPEQS